MSKLSTPRFELRSLYDDGSSSEPELVPVTQVPLDTNVNRRAALRFGGVLGAGVSASLIAHSISARAQGQWKTDTEPAGQEAEHDAARAKKREEGVGARPAGESACPPR